MIEHQATGTNENIDIEKDKLALQREKMEKKVDFGQENSFGGEKIRY